MSADEKAKFRKRAKKEKTSDNSYLLRKLTELMSSSVAPASNRKVPTDAPSAMVFCRPFEKSVSKTGEYSLTSPTLTVRLNGSQALEERQKSFPSRYFNCFTTTKPKESKLPIWH